MGYLGIIVLIIVISLSYVLTIFFTKKSMLVYALIAITSLWVLLSCIGYKYLSSQRFRLSIDIKFKQASEYSDLTGKGIPPLPLPKSTAFAYRSSEKDATYYTTQSNEEIIFFFKSIADKDSYSKDSNIKSGMTKLNLRYKNKPYSVMIDKSIDPIGYYLHVNSN